MFVNIFYFEILSLSIIPVLLCVVSDVLSVPVWCCEGENECEYLNWTLAGLLSPRASRDWTQGLLTHETPSLYHLLFKISAALEYVFRAAMILYNLVTSCHGCQPWTFIHPGPGLAGNNLELSSVDHQDKTLSGKTSQRSIWNHYSIKLSFFDQIEEPHSFIL